MKIKQYISIVSFIAAILIGFIALFLPPEGVIDSSVLWFTSQCLVFTASILGINFSVDYGNKSISGKVENK